VNDINERWLRWRGEGGYKREGGREKRGEFLGGFAYDCGGWL